MSSCSPPSLIVITDDEAEDSTSQPDVISISSDDSADMEGTVSGIDRIRDRSEAMTNEHNFYVALDVACVRYASAEVVRILNFTDDDECYVPWSGVVLHILRWLAIDITARCGDTHWRFDEKDMVRNSLARQYANMHVDTDTPMN